MLIGMSLAFFCMAKKGTDADKIIYDTHANRQISFTGDALYVRPQNFSFGSTELETVFDWGFQLQLKYENTFARALYVEVQHYKTVKNNLGKHLDDFESEGQTLFPYDYLSSFDVVTIQMAKSIYLKSHLDLRFHGGFEYAKLENNMDYTITSALTQSTVSRDYLLQFAGIGGVIGIDINYHLNDDLSIFINNNWQLISQNTRNTDHTVIQGLLNSEIVARFTNKGALLGAYSLAGLHFKKSISNSVIQFEAGWFGLLFNKENLKWSGAGFGLKWLPTL